MVTCGTLVKILIEKNSNKTLIFPYKLKNLKHTQEMSGSAWGDSADDQEVLSSKVVQVMLLVFSWVYYGKLKLYYYEKLLNKPSIKPL